MCNYFLFMGKKAWLIIGSAIPEVCVIIICKLTDVKCGVICHKSAPPRNTAICNMTFHSSAFCVYLSLLGAHSVCLDLWAEPLPDLESQQWSVLQTVWRLLSTANCRFLGQRWQCEGKQSSNMTSKWPVRAVVFTFSLHFCLGVVQHSNMHITNEDKFWYYKNRAVEAIFLSVLLTPWAVKCPSKRFFVFMQT